MSTDTEPQGKANGAGPARRPSAWLAQYQVVKALVLRDMLAQFGNTRLSYLLRIILPLAGFAIIFLVFNLRGRLSPPNLSLPVFLVTGYPFWMAFRETLQQVINVSGREDSTLYFPQVTVLDLIIAKTILEGAANTVVLVILGLLVAVFFQEPPIDGLGVLILFWSATLLGAGVGLALSPAQRLFPVFVQFFGMVLRIGMFISGVIFTVSQIPSWAWPYLTWNPVLHITEGVREAWSGGAYLSPVYDPGYVFICIFLLVGGGLALERITRRHMGA